MLALFHDRNNQPGEATGLTSDIMGLVLCPTLEPYTLQKFQSGGHWPHMPF